MKKTRLDAANRAARFIRRVRELAGWTVINGMWFHQIDSDWAGWMFEDANSAIIGALARAERMGMNLDLPSGTVLSVLFNNKHRLTISECEAVAYAMEYTAAGVRFVKDLALVIKEW